MRRIAITGHRDLDRETTWLVGRRIRRILREQPRPLVGLTCLADGADQIFAWAVIACGGSIESFVPAERFAGSLGSLRGRVDFETLRGLSAVVHTLPFIEPGPESFLMAGRLMVDSADALLAVWDGEPAGGPGGTADVAAYARTRGVPVEVIWPQGATRSGHPQ